MTHNLRLPTSLFCLALSALFLTACVSTGIGAETSGSPPAMPAKTAAPSAAAGDLTSASASTASPTTSIALATPALSSTPRTPPTPISPPADITAEALWSATLSPSDIQQLLFQPGLWWPEFPQFNVGFNADPAGPLPGERFFISQSYRQVGLLASSRIETALILFDNQEDASKSLDKLKSTRDVDTDPVSGPTVGKENRFFTRKVGNSRTPYETTTRFRVGPVLARISTFNQLGYDETRALAKYSGPVVSKITELLEGSLKPTALPSDLAAAMPPESGAPGSVLGTALIPPESWAIADLSNKPEKVEQQLAKLGVTQLGFRRYALAADKSQVVEVILFQFADESDAASWVQDFLTEAHKQGTLDAGNTGKLSAFTDYGGDNYELQFAKGSWVGDVDCFAPFDKTTAACEEPVRKLATEWYAALK